MSERDLYAVINDLRDRVAALEELTTKQAQEIAALQGHDDEADGEDE